MTFELRAFIFLFCILFIVYTLWQVKKNRMMLRYSLIWVLLSVVLFFCALFPEPLAVLAYVLGFQTLSNFVIFIGLFFVLAMCLSYTRAISKKNAQITRLTQQIALLEKRLDDLESRDEKG